MAAGGGGAAMQLTLQTIADHLAGTRAQSGIEYYATSVDVCDGSIPAEFRRWLQGLDHVSNMPNVDLQTCLEVASLKSRGTLRTELERLIQQTAQIAVAAAAAAGNPAPQNLRGWPWAPIRQNLQNTFLSANEPDNLRLELDASRQPAHQNVGPYNIDYMERAARAYPLPRNADAERILVQGYIKSLKEAYMARKVIQRHPANLHAAMTAAEQIATDSERMNKLLGRREEPMDVNILQTPTYPDPIRLLTEKIDALQTSLQQMKDRPQQPTQNQRGSPAAGRGNRGKPSRGRGNTMKWTEDGRAICYRCDRVGHIGRNCRNNPPTPQNWPQKQRGGGSPRGGRPPYQGDTRNYSENY